MAFDIGVIPERVTHALMDRTLIPIIGPGLSKQLNSDIPSWNEFYAKMLAYATEQHVIMSSEVAELQYVLEANKFFIIGERLRSRIPDDALEALMQRLFAPKNAKPSAVH